MSIVPPMHNPLTGNPVRVNVNPHIDREPSRKGIVYSNMKSTKDLNQLIKNESMPTFNDLGDKAVTIMRSTGIDFRI